MECVAVTFLSDSKGRYCDANVAIVSGTLSLHFAPIFSPTLCLSLTGKQCTCDVDAILTVA